MAADPQEVFLCVLFASKAAYHANAEDPEWHDGEVIITPA
jgi:hypothetical protein